MTGKLPLWLLLAAIAAGLIAYSQTRAFAWDEGFHIVTAQLILHGKRPYLDFCFSQAPLNAYWNALWMAVFGESWRVPHALAALGSAAATALAATFVFRRFPDPAWRLPGACLVGILTGLNALVFRFGGISQPYGFCLFLLTAAYCFTVQAAETYSLAPVVLAGLFCGTAANSSLLTAPASPIMLGWLLWYTLPGKRTARLAAFSAGELLAFVPLMWLYSQGPKQVWFGIIDYNLLYRLADWPPADANRQNLEVVLSWIDSGPAIALTALALTGLLTTRIPAFRLCAWLTAGLGIYLAVGVRPTFERYFVFTVPFIAILAVSGVKTLFPGRKWSPVIVVVFLVLFGLGKRLYDEREDAAFSDFEQIARKVDAVTAPGVPLYADEVICFLTKRPPPTGMEEWNSHKFDFEPAKLQLLHLIPAAELTRRVKAGVFPTLETCEDEDYIAEHGYPKLYRQRADVAGCTVFWDFGQNR